MSGASLYSGSPELFWALVSRDDDDKCWKWTGRHFLASGYGNLWFAGKKTTAHRVAYQLANGPIPPGLVVRHKCDNPPCCNPAHLEIGTHADNMRDSLERGQRGFGERAPQAKTTNEQVRAVFGRLLAGESVGEIAASIGVSPTIVSQIIAGEKWGRVTTDQRRDYRRELMRRNLAAFAAADPEGWIALSAQFRVTP